MNIPPNPPARTTADQWPRKRHKDRQRTRSKARNRRGNKPAVPEIRP